MALTILAMDSKNIYIAAQNTSRYASWIGKEHGGWLFIGDGEGFDSVKAQEAIVSFFGSERIYLSVNRHIGFEVPLSKAARELKKHMDSGALLVNYTFKKVMVFSNSGVYRCGQINS